MSFSSKTKDELCSERIKHNCCQTAALSSFVQMAGSLQLASGGRKRVRITTESYAVARWSVAIAKKAFDLQAEVMVRERKRLGKNRSFAILLMGENINDLLIRTGLMRSSGGEFTLEGGVPEALVRNECCRRAFLRGAFLGGGSMSNPEKGYHLEFVVRTGKLAYELCEFLNEYELNAKLVDRKGSEVVYLKEGEKITEFLTLVGANNALFDLEDVRTLKEFRNNLNRSVNCETGNIQKTVNAASRQIEYIEYLIRNDFLKNIDDALKETAELRIENPEATLQELGEMHQTPMGKSGVNHRLRKLQEIASELIKSKGDKAYDIQGC